MTPAPLPPDGTGTPGPAAFPGSLASTRAKAKFKSTVDGLGNAIPSETSSWLGHLHFPQFEYVDNVEVNIGLLTNFLEEVIKAREEVRNVVERKNKFQQLVLSWFKASYPFASLFLAIAKDGASVSSP
jgi:hypothetical protein